MGDVLQPLSSSDLAWLHGIRLIATDMDGTLTQQERFTPALLATLNDLERVGIRVLIVTGRSAGWVSGLSAYLPVAGAIAENGGLYCFSNTVDVPQPLTDIADISQHRKALASTFERVKSRFPHIQTAADNQFRVTDWTFENQAFSAPELDEMRLLCERDGWGFTYSAVQCHVKPAEQNKARGVMQAIAAYFSGIAPTELLTVGDSPNDESLFELKRFPYSIGVANLLHYQTELSHLPTRITSAREGAGFCELAEWLLRSR
ncbi:MAG: HAD family hydrolase [Cyanobacteria bacterium P01_F01_bin.33]